MGELDIAAKALLREEPEAIAKLALGSFAISAVAAEETALPATAVYADKILRYVLAGEKEPRWLHAEIQASPTSDMPRRMFDYWARAFQAFERLSSVLICLKPGERRGDPQSAFVVRGPDGAEINRFTFGVVRVWELKAEELLASGVAGLLPLVPFADGASPASVEQALSSLGGVEPVKHRAELQAVLAAFGSSRRVGDSRRVAPGDGPQGTRTSLPRRSPSSG